MVVKDAVITDDPFSVDDFISVLEPDDVVDMALTFHSSLLNNIIEGVIDDVTYEEGLEWTKETLESLGKSDIIEKLETPQERTDRNKPKPPSEPATYREITTNLDEDAMSESQTKLAPLMRLLESGYMIRSIDIEGGTITFYRNADGTDDERIVTMGIDLLSVLADALSGKVEV